MLGALPDTLIVIFSGMGSREVAAEQVAVGVGTLAGSTMMLLTIATGGSILLGRCDLNAASVCAYMHHLVFARVVFPTHTHHCLFVVLHARHLLIQYSACNKPIHRMSPYACQGKAIDKTLTKPWSFTRTGITTDRPTLQNALVMVISTLLYLTVQVPTLRGLSHDPPAAMAGGIICLIMLAVYAAYQVRED